MNKIKPILILVIIAALYCLYDKLFEIYNHRTIVFIFIGIVIITILYFSLRLCFMKDN